MRLLLDTHVFLWYVSADPQLPAAFRDAISDPANEVYLSAASIWEAVIKYALGKLPFLERLRTISHSNARLTELRLCQSKRPLSYTWPLLHRDPFDRILIAQALQHDLKLVTLDDAIRAYSVQLL